MSYPLCTGIWKGLFSHTCATSPHFGCELTPDSQLQGLRTRSQAPWHSTARHQASAWEADSRLNTWVAVGFLFPLMYWYWGAMPQTSRNGTRAPFLHTKCRVRSRDIPWYLLSNSYDRDRSWWVKTHLWEPEQGWSFSTKFVNAPWQSRWAGDST